MYHIKYILKIKFSIIIQNYFVIFIKKNLKLNRKLWDKQVALSYIICLLCGSMYVHCEIILSGVEILKVGV